MNHRPPLAHPLADQFAATVASIHVLAEHVLCVARHASVGRIGLVASANGVATPAFGDDDRVVAIEGAELVDRSRAGERRAPITTARAAAQFFRVSPGVPGGLWRPVTPLDLDAPLLVDLDASRALAAWFGFVDEALAALASGGADLEPSTLWPEGFDLATTGAAVNYGGSTGDGFLDQPYLYVGPHDHDFPVADPPYWNASFGAALRYDDIASYEDAVAFLVRGFELTSGGARRSA